MAHKIAAMVEDDGRGGRRYPWAEWLDGDVWELVKGEDFTVSPYSFKCVAHQAARRAGLAPTIRIRGNKVYVQARQPE
jgi:hypothetical protein